MNSHHQIPIWVFLISLFLLLHHVTNAATVQTEIKRSLITFLGDLNSTNGQNPDPNFGWNVTTDPCLDLWKGITCDTSFAIRKIVLRGLGLSGNFNAATLCNDQNLAMTLNVIMLDENNIAGNFDTEIGNCKSLTHLFISRNRFSGKFPDALAMLNNLKRLDVSYNQFSGNIPDFSQVSGLLTFLAQHNMLSGKIPDFNFLNLQEFNVSDNNLTGSIPDNLGGLFNESSFINNSGLCGAPLKNPCSSSKIVRNSTSAVGDGNNSNGVSKNRVTFVLANVAAAFVFCFLLCF